MSKKTVIFLSCFLVPCLHNHITQALQDGSRGKELCYCCAAATSAAIAACCGAVGTIIQIGIPRCGEPGSFDACRNRDAPDPVLMLIVPTCCFAALSVYFSHKALRD